MRRNNTTSDRVPACLCHAEEDYLRLAEQRGITHEQISVRPCHYYSVLFGELHPSEETSLIGLISLWWFSPDTIDMSPS